MIQLAAALVLLLLITLALLLFPLRHERRLCILAALAVTFVAGGMYALVGAPRVVPLVAQYHAEVAALEKNIQTTRALVQANPKNLEAWLTLSQALMDKGDFAAASEGFKQAVLLSKGHPRIIAAYAEALILQQGGMVPPQAKKSIDIALMIDPQLPLARYYNAVWLLQEGRNDEAMQEMKALYRELPDDSNLKKRMKAQIGAK